jgi:DNA-binding CsgD family transcriptional regulator
VTISGRDLRRARRFLEDAMDGPSEPFSRPTLQELGRLLGADLVEYFELRERDRVALAYSSSQDVADTGDPLIEATWLEFRHQNPLGAFKWQPASGALRLRSIIGASEIRRLELYPAYWGWFGIRDQLKLWLRRTDETAVCISLDRGDGEFSEREVIFLEVLQPHLAALHDAAMRAAPLTSADVVLTRREAQVLSQAASGRDNDEIATALWISSGTVRKHLENAYRKLGVGSRAEAIALISGWPAAF